MVCGLLQPSAYPGSPQPIQLVETHISWVFLAGDCAYKFKKPLNLGFLDFSDAACRRFYCDEELRLNRRLAPELYLDLAGAVHSQEGWQVRPWREGDEPAVRMRRFPDDARLDLLLAAKRFPVAAMEPFARALASFQKSLMPAPADQDLGGPAAVTTPAFANFRALPQKGLSWRTKIRLRRLESWTRDQAKALAPVFQSRLASGSIREGHGDLHLANLVLMVDRIVAFDGIEFDAKLRWIDLQSEVAFLLADLESKDETELAWRFYNAWIQASGDYDGLTVLRWYLVYRHMVRAKINGIRLAQAGRPRAEARQLTQGQARHIKFAARHTAVTIPRLILMHGYAGSGKSRLAQRLGAALPAIVVRSDVERKRLHGFDPTRPVDGLLGESLYHTAASDQTYKRLATIARNGLTSGLNVVVDAAFLDRQRREEFLQLGLDAGARPSVLCCNAPAEILRERVSHRRDDPSDAGMEVLESQLARREALDSMTASYRIAVETTEDPPLSRLIRRLR